MVCVKRRGRMNNAEIFSQTFGIYATEMWAMPESEFLNWLNSLHDVNATNTTDAISRQELQAQLDCVDRLRMIIDEQVIEVIPRWNVNKIIENLPSAERTGKWVPSHIPESTLCECDQCGFDCGAYSFSYCPNCGARMVSE